MDIELESNIQPTEYQSIFFDRPINSLRKKNIAVLVGINTNIFEIQQLYLIIQAMNHNPILIADESLRSLGLPADMYLSNNNKQFYQNSDEAIARISDCHSLIAGVGLELNSSMQLLLDKVLKSYRGVIILTDSSFKLPSFMDLLSPNSVLLGSTKNLLSLGSKKVVSAQNFGLLRKLELLQNIVVKYGGGLICADEHQLLGLNSSKDTAAVVNSKNLINPVEFMAIFISLLSDSERPSVDTWQKYFLASGYLYRNHYQIKKNPLQIKDFLQNQF